jgi:peptidoglycan hydrolase-like protein with peptidoglycan-binding domain
MALRSKLFRDDPRLQRCLIHDPSHVTPGSAGDHVRRIQLALAQLDGLRIDPSEIKTKRYGRSTTAAVLAFKRRRKIINFSYQTQEDNIVGKMTIAALDREMEKLQQTALTFVERIRCRLG